MRGFYAPLIGSSDVCRRPSLSTSDVACRASVGRQAVRYYERRGFLPEPSRDGNGYRQYDTGAVRRLYFIKRTQELGFSLDAIEELLWLRARPGAPGPQGRSARPEKSSTRRANA